MLNRARKIFIRGAREVAVGKERVSRITGCCKMIKLVLDCETSGLTLPSLADIDRQPRITELAVAVFVRGSLVSEHSWLFNPGVQLSDKIIKITGITNEMLCDQPSFAERIPEIRALFENADQLFAHNANFDVSCMKYELQRAGCNDFPWPRDIFCTVQEYVHEFGHRPTLADLYLKKMGLPLQQAHRALSDVRALVDILKQEILL